MKHLHRAAVLTPLLLVSTVYCSDDDDNAPATGTGGSQTFDNDAGEGTSGTGGSGVSASGGSATGGTNGNGQNGTGTGGVGGSATAGAGGTAGEGAGGIFSTGGTGTGATGGTYATGGTGGAAPGTGGMAATGGSGGTATGGTGGTPSNAITAVAALDPNTCNRTLAYEVSNVRYQSGEAVSNFICHWTFDDGGTSSTCDGSHEFASAGFHNGTVVVADSTTGTTTAVTTDSVPVYDPLVVDVVASAPTCGLSFTYTTTKTGGSGGGMNFVDIQPSQNVVTPGPWASTATVVVTAPGAYTVTVIREEEANNALCTGSDSAEVLVRECP